MISMITIRPNNIHERCSYRETGARNCPRFPKICLHSRVNWKRPLFLGFQIHLEDENEPKENSKSQSQCRRGASFGNTAGSSSDCKTEFRSQSEIPKVFTSPKMDQGTEGGNGRGRGCFRTSSLCLASERVAMCSLRRLFISLSNLGDQCLLQE